jgi:hypothetical protein
MKVLRVLRTNGLKIKILMARKMSPDPDPDLQVGFSICRILNQIPEKYLRIQKFNS